MPLENENIKVMAGWSLEDLQNAAVEDPMALLGDIREMAATNVALRKECDAAVEAVEELMFLAPYKDSCWRCTKDGERCRESWGGCHPEWNGRKREGGEAS